MDGAGYCNRLTAIGIYMCSRRAKAALHWECGVCGGGLTVFVVQVDVAERHAGALSHSHVTQLPYATKRFPLWLPSPQP